MTNHHLGLLLLGLAILLVVLFLIWARTTRALWGKDFWVVFPLLGKMSQWQRMIEGTGEPQTVHEPEPGTTYVDHRLIVPAEKALFYYYTDGLSGRTISPTSFANAREFLKLSQQNGRRPMSIFLWIALALLTIAEAIGTGLLLAPLLSADITPLGAIAVGSVIALAIATVALLITHGAGEDMFRNHLLGKVRRSYRHHGGFLRADGDKAGAVVRTIGPEDDQSLDQENDAVARLAARIHATNLPAMATRYMRIVLSIVFIVVFCAGTTAYRHYLFNGQQDIAASGLFGSASTPDYQSLFQNAQPGISDGTPPLPDAVAHASDNSARQMKNAIADDNADANLAGIIVLALIYVFTQLMGVLTGYKYSFFDGDARKAFDGTRGEISYEAFLRRYVYPVAQRAEMRLGQLRSRLSQANPGYRESQMPFSFLEAFLEADRHRTRLHGKSGSDEPPSASIGVGQEGAPRFVSLVGDTQAQPNDEADYLSLAREILASDPKDRQIVVSNIIRRYGLDTEVQQAALAAAIKQSRHERKSSAVPFISQALLDAAEDE